jgi:heat-inducible transcriptional repressor
MSSGSATELLGALEDKQELKTILSESLDEEEHGLRVYIGDETKVDRMHDCSVVTATYDLGDGVRGTVGIVGPKRMDYEKVMNSLQNLREQFGATLEKAELKIEQKEDG